MRFVSEAPPWWQRTTVYQIYPRSFFDKNGDGIGDLPGILDKLDYLRDLGVETLWLSPFFKSPQRDVGYDISDYYDVAPEYGTRDDVRRLLDAAHSRGLRVILGGNWGSLPGLRDHAVTWRNTHPDRYLDFAIGVRCISGRAPR